MAYSKNPCPLQPQVSGDATRTSAEMEDVAKCVSELTDSTKEVLVFFDLETTGLERSSDITQIAAICGGRSFNVYVQPRKKIQKGASLATGLTIKDDILHYKGEPVSSVLIQEAMLGFIEFLSQLDLPILVGHNILSFDVPVLFNRLREFKMLSEFRSHVHGFVDTLKLAKKIIPKENLKSKSYQQVSLVSDLLGKTYDAHNAYEDVLHLRELYFNKLYSSSGDLKASVHSVESCLCSESLQPLVKEKVMSSLIKDKLAHCTVSLKDLSAAYSADPDEGIRRLFQEECDPADPKPRITSNKTTIAKINKYFEENSVPK